MDQDRWQLVRELFDAALDLPMDEREEYLRNASAGDAEVLSEVKSLLRAEDVPDVFFDHPVSLDQVLALIEPEPQPLQPSVVLCNRFSLVRAIGQGGMGHVYEAWDNELGKPVALKTLRPEISSDTETLKRFRREVSLALEITHPNVCRTFDIQREPRLLDPATGKTSEILFLTMEFLPGETLAARLHRGPLPLDQALLIARQIADALTCAHQLGIVHRDLKPANVMLVPATNGPSTANAGAASGSSSSRTAHGHARAVLMDFGLARQQSLFHPGNHTQISRTGVPMGTLSYMAPEQIEGAPTSAATDIYTFGLVLYEMATGQRAFPTTHPGGLRERLTGDPPSPRTLVPNLPEPWHRAIEGCLRIQPSDRFQSAADVLEVLDGGRVTLPRVRPNRSPRLSFFPNRSRRWRLTAAGILFLLLVSFSYAVFRYQQWKGNAPVDPGALVYLAPIKNETGEKSFDNLGELLQAGLTQSAHINLLTQDRVGDTLQHMTQPPDAQITEPLARDIALRTGAVRVIFPTITGSHGSYNLHIDVQRPDSNGPSRYRNHWQQDFPWQSSSSTNSTTIPQELSSTLRDTNDWIRHLVGESKDDIARLDKPPEDVTTGDWRALADYSNAESLIVHGKRLEALAPLHSAVQRDPNFALAYARLGDILVNLSQISEGYTAYMKALSASEGNRLSLRQRDRIRGIYAQDTGDFQTSEEAFREYSTYYEKDYLGWFYRSRALLMLGRAREAEQSMRRAHDADKTRFGSVGALVRLELVLGDLNEAHHWTQELRNMGANEQAQYSDGIIHLVEGHYFAAGQSFRANLTSQSYRVSSLRLLADLAAEKGQYSDALSFLNQAISGNAEDARILIDRAYVYGKLGQISNCTDDVQSAIAKDSNPNQILSASQILGELLFVTPDPAIRRALNRLASEMPADNFGLISTIAHLRVEGEIQLAAGKTSEALTNFRKADKLEAPFESRDYLARALATAARYSTRSIESGQLRNEAMNLFGQIALHPESVWYFSENYPPGFYTDQLEHQIGLVNQLRPLTSEARSLRSRLLELRPNSKLANY